MMRQFGHFMADGPIQAFYLGACFKVYDTVAEKVQRLFADILGIVPVFQQGTPAQFVPDFSQVMYQFMILIRGLEVFGHLWSRHTFQHIQYEYAVMGGQRTSAFCYDIGMRYSVFV